MLYYFYIFSVSFSQANADLRVYWETLSGTTTYDLNKYYTSSENYMYNLRTEILDKKDRQHAEELKRKNSNGNFFLNL
jgi:hypothetical protein